MLNYIHLHITSYTMGELYVITYSVRDCLYYSFIWGKPL